MTCKAYIPSGEPTIAIVGDFPGSDDDRLGMPFMGSAGKELNSQLLEVGINPGRVMKTHVMMTRPKGNKIDEFLCNKAEAGGKDYLLPPLSTGKYIRPEFLHELERLSAELNSVPSLNLVVAAGNLPLWALCQTTGITKRRGYLHQSVLGSHKVLPILNPGFILKKYNDRPKSIIDWQKAALESRKSTNDMFSRSIQINPSIAEVESIGEFLCQRPFLAVDIETVPSLRHITMIGFAWSKSESFVIPFCRKDMTNYWKSASEEARALRVVRKILLSPGVKIAQNAAYEMQWLWKIWGIPCFIQEDTMLLHHALQPEMQKSLEFLASIYCNLPHWKDWSKGSNKRDE